MVTVSEKTLRARSDGEDISTKELIHQEMDWVLENGIAVVAIHHVQK